MLNALAHKKLEVTLAMLPGLPQTMALIPYGYDTHDDIWECVPQISFFGIRVCNYVIRYPFACK